MTYRIENLSFSYNKKTNILDNISFDINDGELICVLGKNGSGKTTLFNCLLGILNDYDGHIYLENKELNKLKERDIARVVGYVPQNSTTCFGYTVLDYVLMGLASSISIFSKPNKTHVQKALQALQTMNMSDYKDRLFMELSGGEKQQITIARAIVSEPKILFFDEPTAHLDYANQIKVLRMIKDLSKKGYSVVFSSHDPNHALMFDCNVVLFDGLGKIQKDSAKQIITEERLNKVYGSDLKIIYSEELKRSICTYSTI